MFENEVIVPNNTGKPLSIWIEPWAFSWDIPKDATCKIVGDSEIDGEFELIERRGELEIYGWSGCNLKIYTNDKLVLTEDLRAPGGVPGMSMRSMTDMLFAGDPKTKKT